MPISSNNGIVFIQDDNLLIVKTWSDCIHNPCLTVYSGYGVDCWKIDFDVDKYEIYDINSIFVAYDSMFVIMNDGVVYFKGDDYNIQSTHGNKLIFQHQ